MVKKECVSDCKVMIKYWKHAVCLQTRRYCVQSESSFSALKYISLLHLITQWHLVFTKPMCYQLRVNQRLT